jgi:16S rRNA (cytidine1402-2'-O)-methyltransferase
LIREILSKLNLITLPIGNPEDITLRALKELKLAKTIYCEDTRTLKSLLKYHQVDYSDIEIISFHDHSSEEKIKNITLLLKAGKEIAYVSDAGSPVLSDPAYPLAKFCRENGIEINSIGGISSVTCALEMSGLAPHPFCFYGFLGRDASAVRESFFKASNIGGTHLYFESPHRLKKTLQILAQGEFEFEGSVVKEISKTFQNAYHFDHQNLNEVMEQIDYRGEFVIAVNFSQKISSIDPVLKKLAQKVFDSKGKKKDLSRLLGEILELDFKEIYKEI